MNQTYTCTDLFPTWYKSIDPQMTEEVINKRIDAIKNIIESVDTSLWFDVVRLSLGLPVQDQENRTNLVETFRVEDVSFPLTGNDNIIKVLSEITLCFLFESENEIADVVNLAVINSNFFGQFSNSPIPFAEYAAKRLVQPSQQMNLKITQIQTDLTERLDVFIEDEDEVIDNNDYIMLAKSINYLTQENKRLNEETNILWWLFGQYSFLNDQFFTDLGVNKMIITSAAELSDLSKGNKSLISAPQLLQRALVTSKTSTANLKDCTIIEAIDEVPPKVKAQIITKIGTVNELTPVLFALQLSNQFDEKGLWTSAFNKQISNIDLKKKFKPQEIACQFYNEIMFLKSL